MTDLAAAIGRAQLDRLPTLLERRQSLAAAYRARLSGVQMQRAYPQAIPNAQTLGVLLPEPLDRDAVVDALRERGIQAGRLSYAIHRLGSLPNHGRDQDLPVASKIEDRGLALPLYPELSEEALEAVTRALGEVLEEAG